MDRAILVHRGVVEVRLPAIMSPAAFEAKLRAALEPMAGRYAVDLPDDDGTMTLWTRQRHLGVAATRATEIYRFRPREDGDHLVALVEQILKDARAESASAAKGDLCVVGAEPTPMTPDELLALLDRLFTSRLATLAQAAASSDMAVSADRLSATDRNFLAPRLPGPGHSKRSRLRKRE